MTKTPKTPEQVEEEKAVKAAKKAEKAAKKEAAVKEAGAEPVVSKSEQRRLAVQKEEVEEKPVEEFIHPRNARIAREKAEQE